MTSQRFNHEDGFRLDPSNHHISNFALISLRKALFSYFSTYQSLKYDLKLITNLANYSPFSDEQMNYTYTRVEYLETYTETVLHFHHFIELVCKEIMKSKHPLLVVNAQKKHELFYQLIKNPDLVSNNQIDNLNTLDFLTMIDRMNVLISNGWLESKYSFIKEYSQIIWSLNKYRNEITHKGVFVLKYLSLDIFIGKYILPLVKEIINLSECNQYEYILNARNINSSIRPVDEIINECKNKDSGFNFEKIAVLKEIGRSSFLNPLTNMQGVDEFEWSRKDKIRRAIQIAEHELESSIADASLVEGVNKCPVCGVKSLITYEEHYESGEMEDGTYERGSYNYNIKCHCCSFELHHAVGNSTEHGLPLNDYFY